MLQSETITIDPVKDSSASFLFASKKALITLKSFGTRYAESWMMKKFLLYLLETRLILHLLERCLPKKQRIELDYGVVPTLRLRQRLE